nr:hypothetical protein [Sedimentibacter sp.]
MDLEVYSNLNSVEDKDEALILLMQQITKDETVFDNDINDIVNIFDDIYKNQYHHKYSLITGVVLELGELKDGSAEFLIGFLNDIYKEIEHSNERLKLSIGKLIDHINLELVRQRHLNEHYGDHIDLISDKINNVDNKVNSMVSDASERIVELDVNMKKSENKLKGYESQSITILGIFSGIVMVFFGGLNFAANAFQNINNISIYRLTFVICLIGFIMFNCVFILIHFVSKLTNSEIKEKCNKCTNEIAMTCYSIDENSKGTICQNYCNPVEKFKNLYPVVFYVDIFLVTCMVTVFLIWSISHKKYIDLGLVIIMGAAIHLIYSYVGDKRKRKYNKGDEIARSLVD